MSQWEKQKFRRSTFITKITYYLADGFYMVSDATSFIYRNLKVKLKQARYDIRNVIKAVKEKRK